MMDLFDKKDDNFGFHSNVAKMLVKIYNQHYSESENVTYPFNHIRAMASYGYTKLVKPMRGLSRENANRLKELGYDVSFDPVNKMWTISWKD